MTLRHLNIFLTVCREKSMTKAAEKLYITQPSVTQAIKELEEYYSAFLFERTGKRIKISKEGYRLLPIAENIVKSFEESKNIMKNAFSYECTLGASVTVGTYFLSQLYEKFSSVPNLNIKYVIDNTFNIEQMILDSKIDIGLVEGEIHSKQLISKPFLEDQLGLVCSINSPFSNFDSIKIRELNDCKFIFREEGSGTKELIELIFHQNNINIETVGIVNNIEAIKNMIINNLGVSILPKLSVTKELESKVISYIEIKDISISRNFKLIYHKDKILNKYLDEILNIVLN